MAAFLGTLVACHAQLFTFTRDDVIRYWLVLRQSLGMILAGVSLGIAAAWAAGRILGRLVEGMQPPEPSTFAIMTPVLVVAALVASFLPAHRASQIDPVRALRQEQRSGRFYSCLGTR